MLSAAVGPAPGTVVWLPADADRAAVGELPASLVPTVAPHRPADVEFVVLDPRQRSELVELLPSLTSLRVVQTLNAGVDWVPPLPDGVLLCNAAGVHDGPVAEWTIASILAMQKRLPDLLDQQRQGHWDTTGNLAFADGPAARDLSGSTVLIVGQGSIGTAVADRLRPFGTRTVGVARHPRPGVSTVEDLATLVPDADVVVLLAPATAETRHLVDADFLDRMRPGALLVNASRGSLVDGEALLSALRQGRVRAALDATDPEPLPDGHPLWSAPDVLITPHVAGSSANWRRRAYQLVGDQLRRYADGRELRNVRRHGY